jgi:hypothetical protein
MNHTLSQESTLLFSVPSFLRGMARVLDLGSTFDVYNTSDSAEEADRIALETDWIQVGRNISDVMRDLEHAK